MLTTGHRILWHNPHSLNSIIGEGNTFDSCILLTYYNPHSLVLIHDSSQQQAHKEIDRCGHHQCHHSNPRGLKCAVRVYALGLRSVGSSRIYYISMVIYTDPYACVYQVVFHGSLLQRPTGYEKSYFFVWIFIGPHPYYWYSRVWVLTEQKCSVSHIIVIR